MIDEHNLYEQSSLLYFRKDIKRFSGRALNFKADPEKSILLLCGSAYESYGNTVGVVASKEPLSDIFQRKTNRQYKKCKSNRRSTVSRESLNTLVLAMDKYLTAVSIE